MGTRAIVTKVKDGVRVTARAALVVMRTTVYHAAKRVSDSAIKERVVISKGSRWGRVQRAKVSCRVAKEPDVT